MTPVPNLTDLPKTVMYFACGSLEASLKEAERWADKRGVKLTGYYVQKAHGGKSIIAGYTLSSKP
jgi:hypothetical protein